MKKLYQLILEAVEKDPESVYANLYNPNQPLALLHMQDDELQTFILYHLTNNRQYPVYVVAYLNMELMEEQPCIPYTYQVLGVYTEAAAQRRGFSRTMYNMAFYIADRMGYGLTSDHLVGTTKVAQNAAWEKFEKSSEYYKRATPLGNQKFDYTGNETNNKKII
jgi:GNAT superfamily N-acetyltransferase